MTKEDAIKRLETHIAYHQSGAWPFTKTDKAMEMAIAALKEQKTPCAACGYGGKHLDAPPCTTCPAHPKLESNLRVFESNRAESDTVKAELLTLDELRQMQEATPVWWQCSEKTGFWCLAQTGVVMVPSGRCYDISECEGQLYRNKIKESE